MMVEQGLRPIIGECPEELKQLIIRCWDGEPTRRPSKLYTYTYIHTRNLFL